MKLSHSLTILTFALLLMCSNATPASTSLTGTKITFVKAAGADWTLAENQDRISDHVWITRAATQGLFNIAPGQETQYDRSGFTSPRDTQWAPGKIASGIDNLSFASWQAAVVSPTTSVGKDYVLHLLSNDIYIDVKFLSWQSGPGGGYSYERTTPVPVPASIWFLTSALAALAHCSNHGRRDRS